MEWILRSVKEVRDSKLAHPNSYSKVKLKMSISSLLSGKSPSMRGLHASYASTVATPPVVPW